MDRRSMAVASLALTLTLAMVLPMGALAKGKPTVTRPRTTCPSRRSCSSGVFTGVTVRDGGRRAVCSVASDRHARAPAGRSIQRPTTTSSGVNKWQAQAYTYVGTTVKTGTAEWGDNLSGDAKLKVGSPIRVELGLFDDTGVSLHGLHRGQAGTVQARPRVRVRDPGRAGR